VQAVLCIMRGQGQSKSHSWMKPSLSWLSEQVVPHDDFSVAPTVSNFIGLTDPVAAKRAYACARMRACVCVRACQREHRRRRRHRRAHRQC